MIGTKRRRLLREARVTAQLQHPNTVPVYDIGDDPSEGIYFVMKRISGENLFEVLQANRPRRSGDDRSLSNLTQTGNRPRCLPGALVRSYVYPQLSRCSAAFASPNFPRFRLDFVIALITPSVLSYS